MSLSDTQRQQLRQGLAQRLDEQTATLLMEALPPMDTSTIATKDDIAATEAVLRAEMSGLAVRMDSLDGRMDGLETHMSRLDGRMDSLETHMDRLDGRMDSFEAKLDAMNIRFDGQGAALNELATAVVAQNNALAMRIDAMAVSLGVSLEAFGREQRNLVFGVVALILATIIGLGVLT